MWKKEESRILSFLIEVPAGIQEEFFDKLNGLAHGEVESKILNVR